MPGPTRASPWRRKVSDRQAPSSCTSSAGTSSTLPADGNRNARSRLGRHQRWQAVAASRASRRSRLSRPSAAVEQGKPSARMVKIKKQPTNQSVRRRRIAAPEVLSTILRTVHEAVAEGRCRAGGGLWTVDQELMARNEYLAAENRILKVQLKGRLKFSDAERGVLGEIGHRLGRKVLADVATVARPETILGWYRKLVARKFDGSKARRGPGRPRIKREVEQLIIRMPNENRDWGYDRIAGALANLGYQISYQTVGNVPRRHGLPPAPERKRSTSWTDFIRTHVELLAGTDFFTAEVLTLRG